MSPFHPNLGYAFAQPYESDYAILRRCLTANPGVSLSAIQQQLRESASERATFFSRMHALQLHSEVANLNNYSKQWLTYRRQCPICAQLLYHTDIYALPWLTHCPLHHCAFTSECPVCHRPWPDIHEMAKRSCPGCSRLTIEQLHVVLPRLASQNYQPIADVYALISRNDLHSVARLADQNDLNSEFVGWCRNAPLTSSIFPSFQAHHHPRVSDRKLEALHIASHEVHAKYLKLKLIQPVPENIQSQMHKRLLRQVVQVTNDIPRTRLIADFSVMRQVVNWIARHTPNNHSITLASYRYMPIEDFFDAPDPCPYCLAFSLWFFHTLALLYGAKTVEVIDDYPFCWAARTESFLSGYHPYIVLGKDYFMPSPDFATWFYCRGVEVSFVDMLRFSFDFLRQLNDYRRDTNTYKDIAPYQSGDAPERLCSFEEVDGHYFFYYENEHPLEHCNPAASIVKVEQCCRYQEFHKSHRRDMNTALIGNISEEELTYTTYLSLQNNYRDFLNNLWQSF